MEQKKLLFIGLVWPEPKSSAAGMRSVQLLALFQEKGFAITVASAAQNLAFSEDLTPLGYGFQPIAVNDPAFDVWVHELQPDIVIFDRYITEEQFGWRVREQCPHALTLLDTQDVHFLRLARQKALQLNVPISRKLLFSDIAKRELAAYYRSDLVVVLSQFEYEWLQSEWQFPTSQLLYLPLFGEKSPSILPLEHRADFVFIGNFMHEPNWDAVVVLKNEVWPQIRLQIPQAQLRIYGAYMSEKVQQLHHPKDGFHVMGRAENALEVLAASKLMLAPLRFGAGIKGKLLEAMQVGTPSITTSIGAEGMQFDTLWSGAIANNWDDFAKQAVCFYNDNNSWEQAQHNGFEILFHQFSKQNYLDQFWNTFSDRSAHRNQHREKNVIGQLLNHHTIQSTKYMAKWIEVKNRK